MVACCDRVDVAEYQLLNGDGSLRTDRDHPALPLQRVEELESHLAIPGPRGLGAQDALLNSTVPCFTAASVRRRGVDASLAISSWTLTELSPRTRFPPGSAASRQ